LNVTFSRTILFHGLSQSVSQSVSESLSAVNGTVSEPKILTEFFIILSLTHSLRTLHNGALSYMLCVVA